MNKYMICPICNKNQVKVAENLGAEITKGVNAMNREIKFRAYCKLTKTMIYDYLVLKDGLFHGYDLTNNNHEIDDVMQYTGLKDKTGKEIYEGDIVNNLYTVKFGKYSLEGFYLVQGFYLHDKRDEYDLMELENQGLFKSFIEVTGNIYE